MIGALETRFGLSATRDADALARHGEDARYGRGRPALVLRPRDGAETCAMLTACAEAGIHVIPQGGNTGLVAGSRPDGTGEQVVLDLAHLRAPFELDPVNRSLHVGAGLRLSEVNARSAEAGLCLPIDLGADPTIGGMIASNTGGARFVRYGGMREQVLGLDLALPGQDAPLALGRGTHKTSEGPALHQLVVGSEGALGVVTAATLKLHPLPAQRAAAIVVPAGPASVAPLLMRLEARLGPVLTAFEGMSQAAMEMALAHVPGLSSPFAGAVPETALLVEASAGWPEADASVEEMLQAALLDALEAGEAIDALFGSPERSWTLRHALSEGMRHAGGVLGIDAALPRGAAMPFAAAMAAAVEDAHPGLRACPFGHIGDGAVHFNVHIPPGHPLEDDDDAREALRDRVLDAAVAAGGTYSAEHGIGRRNAAAWVRHTAPETRALLARLVRAVTDAPLGASPFRGDTQ